MKYLVDDALEDLLRPRFVGRYSSQTSNQVNRDQVEHSLLLVLGHQPIFDQEPIQETNHRLVRELKEGS
jgi:hypothetical protein